MKTNSPDGTILRTAIVQLKHVARTKREQSVSDRREKTILVQEARQVDEAVRLLRWIRK